MIDRFKEVGRFLTSGAFNTLLSYLMFLFFNLYFEYLVAYTLAYVFGVFSAYALHSIFVFREKLSFMKSAQYQVMYVLLYVVSITTVYLLVELLNSPEALAPVLAMLVTVPVSYILGRLVIKGES
ncbi:MAG: GtrA family protein [Pseudomonadales bacterium]